MLKFPTVIAMSAVVALGACTDPGALGTVGPSGEPINQKRNTGAAIGAASGAVLGAVLGDRKTAVAGAVAGGLIGGAIGYDLDQQEAELRRELASGVTITNTGDRLIVSFPEAILFATDSFTVRPGLNSDMAALARSLDRYPASTVQIVGHTDSDGDAAYNQQLSERRANAVADVLLNQGVPFNRIQTFGRGESQPIATNLTPEGKQQNRRVEIVILPTAQ
ncbi:membrane protein [Tateyamaria omphalii]|uniref:OmpA family protein n=1 Tax=Tateyamaria omphalii TaxID=299262 RepID=UPI00167A20FA|nr:OmpA family protein [Tateyamaria omphalii]GGX42748.1 membrane protein [Tateyamaria omphalii]